MGAAKPIPAAILAAWVFAAMVLPANAADPVLAAADASLPFDMPPPDAVLNASRKVFAHYFSPLPLSIDNLPADKDYYAVNYLAPGGEGGKFAGAGGLLRERPVPVRPRAASNWQVLNMQEEIRRAIRRGINGFAFDIMGADDAEAGGKLRMMLDAARRTDPRFKIVLMPDMYGLSGTAAVAGVIRAVQKDPALFRLGDGRLVLAPFATERIPPADWSAMLDELKKEGIKIAFLPTFGSLAPSIVTPYFSMKPAGMGNFGNPGTPDQLEWVLAGEKLVHAHAPLFLCGITPQTYKPESFMYSEAQNSLAYRNAWTGAIRSRADMVQIVTWNDFGESTAVSPVTSQHGDAGTGFYDLTGYYATWFQTRQPPRLVRDALYYFYRKTPVDAAAGAQSKPMTTQFPQTPRNEIELLAFLKSPGTLSIGIGGKTVTKNASAGLTSFTVPLAPGVPEFQLIRNGSPVIRLKGGTRIYDRAGLPTGVLDLTYWSGGKGERL